MATLAATSRWHASNVTGPQVAWLAKLAGAWPLPKVFPLLDLLRVACLHPDGAKAVAGSSLFDGALKRALDACAGGGNAHSAALPLVSLRLAANLFYAVPCRLQAAAMPGRAVCLVTAAAGHVAGDAKNARLAAAAVLLNYAFALGDASLAPGSVAGPPPPQLYEAAASACAAACGTGAAEASDPETLAGVLGAARQALEATGDIFAARASALPAAVAVLVDSGKAGKAAEHADSLKRMLS